MMTEYPFNDYRAYIIHNDLDMKYGLPEKKKYPMPDRDHVMSAIRFFNYVSPSDEKELARNIVARIKEYGITDINVGEKNRFGKYYKPEQYIKHHGVKGVRWKKHKYMAIVNGRYIYPPEGVAKGTRQETISSKDNLALHKDVESTVKEQLKQLFSSDGSMKSAKKPSKRSIFAKYLSKKKYGGITSVKKSKSGGVYSGSKRSF